MPLACKYCIAAKGLKGSEISSLPKNEEELADHIEREHHVIVIRKDETEDQATERFKIRYPETANCRECIEAGLW